MSVARQVGAVRVGGVSTGLNLQIYAVQLGSLDPNTQDI